MGLRKPALTGVVIGGLRHRHTLAGDPGLLKWIKVYLLQLPANGITPVSQTVEDHDLRSEVPERPSANDESLNLIAENILTSRMPRSEVNREESSMESKPFHLKDTESMLGNWCFCRDWLCPSGDPPLSPTRITGPRTEWAIKSGSPSPDTSFVVEVMLEVGQVPSSYHKSVDVVDTQALRHIIYLLFMCLEFPISLVPSPGLAMS
ncbi:hypothetical protein KIL84_021702 [Mauremys mutica]|uniref:Uncharacterized protein n=1 Tax=Mauremys mutica TaxID=74926 RepID=A0A9D4AYJ5_9SAUR|nr:hypothetical protein KIL84_021702 [Mauremys mutica]